MIDLQQRRVVLAVSGSIAIAKSLDVLSRLKKAGAQVRVAMTPGAEKMIAPVTFEALTGHPVYAAMWDTERSHEMEHLTWSKWAELLLVAPATANTLAALAHGFADNAVTSTALAYRRGPTVVCPAMNPAMFDAPATQANLATLRERGVLVCGPIAGPTACGDEGPGRMAEAEQIVAFVADVLAGRHAAPSSAPETDIDASLLRGRRVLLTVGPTREPIDAVRFLSNASTGKMGFELARAAARRGARVEMVCGPTPLEPPADPAIAVERVTTALEMHAATLRRATDADVAIFTAAVADFRPAKSAARKMKKGEIDQAGMALVANPDIAADVGALDRPGQIRVAFAAETHDLAEHALAKLARKNCHLVVANNVSEPGVGFATDTNAVSVFTRGEAEPVAYSLRSKAEIADRILDHVEVLMAARAHPTRA